MGNYTLPNMGVLEIGPGDQTLRIGDIKANYAGGITVYNYETHRRDDDPIDIDGEAVLEAMEDATEDVLEHGPAEIAHHVAIGPYEACALFQEGYLSREHIKDAVASPALGVKPLETSDGAKQTPFMFNLGNYLSLGLPVIIDASFDGVAIRTKDCKPMFAGMAEAA